MSDVIAFPPRLRIVHPPALPTAPHDQAHAIALRIEALVLTLERLCPTRPQQMAARVLSRLSRDLADSFDDTPPGDAA